MRVWLMCGWILGCCGWVGKVDGEERRRGTMCVWGRTAAEGFSPTSPRAHWIGPES